MAGGKSLRESRLWNETKERVMYTGIGTINLGPTCISDWCTVDVPEPDPQEGTKTYLFVISNPAMFAGIDAANFHNLDTSQPGAAYKRVREACR
jgi:hypothetical protein